jgi:hypothetical protein
MVHLEIGGPAHGDATRLSQNGSTMTKTILPFILGAIMPLLLVAWLLIRN